MLGASEPMAGFGSSDCDCKTHLSYFKDCSAKRLSSMAMRLGSTVAALCSLP
jgi:Uri superfamily endonuclease